MSVTRRATLLSGEQVQEVEDEQGVPPLGDPDSNSVVSTASRAQLNHMVSRADFAETHITGGQHRRPQTYPLTKLVINVFVFSIGNGGGLGLCGEARGRPPRVTCS